MITSFARRSIALVAVSLLVNGAAWAASLYNVNEIPGLGGIHTTPLSINNKNQVVGIAATEAGYPHAFLYNYKDDEIIDLHDQLAYAPDSVSEAYRINDHGDIVGTVQRDSVWLLQVAFLLQPEKEPLFLGAEPPLNTYEYIFATDITDEGLLLGQAGRAKEGGSFVYRYKETKKPKTIFPDLGLYYPLTLFQNKTDENFILATQISDQETIVGLCDSEACVKEGDKGYFLDEALGFPVVSEVTTVSSKKSTDLMAGWFKKEAFSPISLFIVDSHNQSEAQAVIIEAEDFSTLIPVDINKHGVIVGYGIEKGVSIGILLKPTHNSEQPYELIKLNNVLSDPSWKIIQAFGVNDKGFIIALAKKEGTETVKAVLLMH